MEFFWLCFLPVSFLTYFFKVNTPSLPCSKIFRASQLNKVKSPHLKVKTFNSIPITFLSWSPTSLPMSTSCFPNQCLILFLPYFHPCCSSSLGCPLSDLLVQISFFLSGSLHPPASSRSPFSLAHSGVSLKIFDHAHIVRTIQSQQNSGHR